MQFSSLRRNQHSKHYLTQVEHFLTNLQISNSVLLISNQDTNIADIDFILDRYEGQQTDQGIPKDLSVVHLVGHLNT